MSVSPGETRVFSYHVTDVQNTVYTRLYFELQKSSVLPLDHIV